MLEHSIALFRAYVSETGSPGWLLDFAEIADRPSKSNTVGELDSSVPETSLVLGTVRALLWSRGTGATLLQICWRARRLGPEAQYFPKKREPGAEVARTDHGRLRDRLSSNSPWYCLQPATPGSRRTNAALSRCTSLSGRGQSERKRSARLVATVGERNRLQETTHCFQNPREDQDPR